MAVENAPEHERIWIEDIYQNIFCGTSQGTRKQADGIVAVWRSSSRSPTRRATWGSARDLQPPRACGNGETVLYDMSTGSIRCDVGGRRGGAASLVRFPPLPEGRQLRQRRLRHRAARHRRQRQRTGSGALIIRYAAPASPRPLRHPTPSTDVWSKRILPQRKPGARSTSRPGFSFFSAPRRSAARQAALCRRTVTRQAHALALAVHDDADGAMLLYCELTKLPLRRAAHLETVAVCDALPEAVAHVAVTM